MNMRVIYVMLLFLFVSMGRGQTIVKYFESIAIDSVARLDSLGTDPAMTVSAGKMLIYPKASAAGDIGLYRKIVGGGVKRIDSSFATVELAGRRSVVFVREKSVTAADSTLTDIWAMRGTGVIDSVTFIMVGASSATWMLVKDSLGTRRDCFTSNTSVTTSTTSVTTGAYWNLANGHKFFIVIRSVSGTMTWFKCQVFIHITS
jgi:hypothetical protein